MSILAIGDIHGMQESLSLLLREILPKATERTRLVFLGDYIDRGPDSFAVVETLLRLKEKRPDTVFLLGNHEKMLLDACDGRKREFFMANGGDATLASYNLEPDRINDLPKDHLAFFRSLRLYFETEDYIFVHAGLRPGYSLYEQDENDLLWIRDDFIYSPLKFGKTVIFGHTPLTSPFVRTDRIGIDTGAVYGNYLTCLRLPERQFYAI